MNDNEEDGATGRREDQRIDYQHSVSNGKLIKRKRPRGNDTTIEVKCKKQNQNVVYCCHCGNDEVSTDNSLCSDCERLETTINTAKTSFVEKIKYKRFLTVGIHVQYLYLDETTRITSNERKRRKHKRKLKTQEILDKVSALLNTESGHILIHFVGRNEEGSYKGAFDVLVDEKLTSLINDGSLFCEVYQKQFLFENSPNFLVLTVERSKYIVTSDFKTKYSTDVNVVDIQENQLRRLLKDKKKFDPFHHKIDVKQLESGTLHECRNIQFKEIFEQEGGDNCLANKLLGELRLTNYVSAFSKNKDGGSYVAGVKEVPENQDMTYQYTPAIIHNPDNFPRLLRDLLMETYLVCDYEGNIKDVDDLVKITLKEHTNGGQHHMDNYIIVVSVRPMQGVVFYHQDGPVAYIVSANNTNSIERLSFESWFNAFIEVD